MVKTPMSTVDKALALLRHFSVAKPELGLSELARLAQYDKTTTLRCMTALERNGFVEQDADSRKYRLGLATVNLAQIRQQSFPVQAMLKRHLDELSDRLHETAHATLIMGNDPVTAATSEPDRALRVHVDPSEVLPLHATASGLAIAAFMPKETRDELLSRRPLKAITEATVTDPRVLGEMLETCRRTRISRARETFESGVIGTASPIFGPGGDPIGAIAVAAVATRVTPDLQRDIDAAVLSAATRITRGLGGTHPVNPAQNKELIS